MLKRKSSLLGLVIFFVVLHTPDFFVHGSETGKLYVVGMGPAGPDLTAPRALKIIEKADVLLCSPRMPDRFERFGLHIDPGKVAFDPWEGIVGKEANNLKKRNPEVWMSQAEKQVKKVQDFIIEKLREDRTVVMMDGGDPCVYGPSLSRLLKGFDEDLFEVIPGMGAFNAGAAALKKPMIGENSRFILLTSPKSLLGEPPGEDDILKDLSKYDSSMVFYMGLKTMPDLVERMKPYFPPDYPISIVYFAGYPDKERVLKSRLDRILEDLKTMDESWLGLVFMGKCLQ
jgi:precorrin-4 methylase